MYYIAGVLGDNTYLVGDTKDGVKEKYTYNQVRDFVLNGLKIRGTSYSDRESLRTKGFWNIKAVDINYIIDIKEGHYYSITVRNFNRDSVYSFTGYCMSIDYSEDLLMFTDIEGSSRRFQYEYIVAFKEVRVNKSIQGLMSEMKSLQLQANSIKLEMKRLEDEYREIQDKIEGIPSKFAALSSHITVDDFRKIVMNNISDSLLRQINMCNYRFSVPSQVAYNDTDIFLTFTEIVYLSGKESFVNSRTLEINTSSDEYKNAINHYRDVYKRKKLDVNTSLESNLVSLDGRGKFLYQQWYKFSFRGIELTEENAIKFAKSVGGR